MSTKAELISELSRAKAATSQLRASSLDSRNKALSAMSELLSVHQAALLAENQKDLAAAEALSEAMKDRLTLNDERIAAMQTGLKEIMALPDPIGTRRAFSTPPSGIHVFKQRIPLGVIIMIYESRPNVAVDAAALALKAGNAIVLRGGKEANFSNRYLGDLWKMALHTAGLSQACVLQLTDTGREDMKALIARDDLLDLVIPRGGEGLIRFVAEHSRVPVIKHYKGVCHLYIDESADLNIAKKLLIDGKLSRPGVCNALETLLVHRAVVETIAQTLADICTQYELTLFADEPTRSFISEAKLLTEEGYDAEYLAKKLSVKLVHSLDEAIAHIDKHGSQHTEVICTQNDEHAAKFLNRVDASAVMINASSRFNDGGELGLGAEIGIATTKLHAYGPMGLEALTAEKFVVLGEGQTRHGLV